MTSPDMDDEAMKAMARRIVNANSNYMNGLDRGQINFTAQEVLQIALAAIIETRDRDAAVVESLAMTAADEGEIDLVRTIHAAIRSGQQFRKDV